jgi:AbrB family looped-hinge helix DNA binding protein
MGMKIGERGHVTIPKLIRDQFGLGPDSNVEIEIIQGAIVLKKVPKPLDLKKWRGYCKDSLNRLEYTSVDEFVDDVRGK